VTSFTDTEFTCEIAAADAVSDTTTPKVGLQGVSTFLYSGTTPSEDTLQSKQVWTAMESRNSIANYFSQEYKAWFIPPETTRYRFYMSCDDICEMHLGNTPNSAIDTTVLIDADGYTNYRDYFR